MKRRKHDSKGLVFSLALLTLFLAFSIIPSIGIAEEETDTLATLRDDANILWTCLAAFIVFFMQAGFALVESGFTRAKNVCNIIMKNLMDISLGSIIFWAIGFSLMFGVSGGWIGGGMMFFDGSSEAAKATGNSEGFNWAFLIFQTVFCATAATIVSGSVAERTKFSAYFVYSIIICAFIYPIFGSWCWGGLYAGGGWLENLETPFLDYAGSTVVHSIGGWAALAGAIVVGARKGKYNQDGTVNPIPGHNIPMGALGVFILWLGWFGFNPGSTTSVGRDMAYIAVTTNLSAAAGAIGAVIATWIFFGKPDPSLGLNGALAGLVSITAGCDVMSPGMAALTGLIGGFLVVGSVVFFDKLKIDDPVGAVSVHGVCGAWGTLAVGIFSSAAGGAQFLTQLYGVIAGFVWAFGTSFVMFSVIKATIGMRVDEEDEREGLDLTEHGVSGYVGVSVFE